MTVQVGGLIWIPCEVKPGAFSNERLVRIASDSDEWLGFVPVESLHDDVVEGTTFIRGTISAVYDERFEVLLPGDAVTPNVFAGSISRVTSLGSVEAGHSPLY